MSTDNAIAPSAIAPPEGVDVSCPLCEYNLRGLAEPRCPECGHRSTWEELLNRPPLHPYLFEHYPRHNIWSFVRTFFGSLRPIKFWRNVTPVMPLRIKRLIVFGLICLFLGLAGSSYGLFSPIAQIAQRNISKRHLANQLMTAALNPASPNYNRTMAARVQSGIRRYGSLNAYLDVINPPVTSSLFWKNVWQNSLWTDRSQRAMMRTSLIALLWIPLTILSLMIFRASMRQAKIRTGHVLRCVFYSATPLVIYGFYLLVATALFTFFFGRVSWWYDYVDEMYLACMSFVLILALRLMCAYRLYLRFHYAIATVIASQLIVALALMGFDLKLLGY